MKSSWVGSYYGFSAIFTKTAFKCFRHVKHMHLQLWCRSWWVLFLLIHMVTNGDGANCSSNIQHWVCGLWYSNLFFTSTFQKGEKNNNFDSASNELSRFLWFVFQIESVYCLSFFLSFWGFNILCAQNYSSLVLDFRDLLLSVHCNTFCSSDTHLQKSSRTASKMLSVVANVINWVNENSLKWFSRCLCVCVCVYKSERRYFMCPFLSGEYYSDFSSHMLIRLYR